MTDAHNEKIIDKALDFAVELIYTVGLQIGNSKRFATETEIKEFLFEQAYKDLGYTKDSLGRWCYVENLG